VEDITVRIRNSFMPVAFVVVLTMPFNLKRKFLKKWFFSSNVIKTPEVLKRRSIKKREEREKLLKKEERKNEEEKEKLQESLQIKGKSIFWEEKNTSTSKYPFWCDSIFSPSVILFQKPFPKLLTKFS
jgi:hypothetical protein